MQKGLDPSIKSKNLFTRIFDIVFLSEPEETKNTDSYLSTKKPKNKNTLFVKEESIFKKKKVKNKWKM